MAYFPVSPHEEGVAFVSFSPMKEVWPHSPLYLSVVEEEVWLISLSVVVKKAWPL